MNVARPVPGGCNLLLTFRGPRKCSMDAHQDRIGLRTREPRHDGRKVWQAVSLPTR
jgi:hypothetical protein